MLGVNQVTYKAGRFKWTFQLGKKIHANYQKIYNFDLKLSISIFVLKTWFTIATAIETEFTWCSDPRHTLEGIYEYLQFSMAHI